MPHEHSTSRWVVRASIAGLLAVLCFLAGFSVLTQRRVAAHSEGADLANRLTDVYQDARFWLGQEESLERKYRLEPTPAVGALHSEAEARLASDLRRLPSVDAAPGTGKVVEHLLRLHADYRRASHRMFRAVDAHDAARVIHLDHAVVDPVFAALEQIVYTHASLASKRALTDSAKLRREESAATRATAIAFSVGVGLLLGFWLIIARFRRRLDDGARLEVERLAQIALTDPLTGLYNHRAFHEDLACRLHAFEHDETPVSLVMLDLDGLKQINDSLGHQAGDAHLHALADAITATGAAGRRGYRIGGDEFAVILEGVRAWDALELVQRLRTALEAADLPVSVSAGISEALRFVTKDSLVREADLALIATKRSGQHVAIYTREMEPDLSALDRPEDAHHTRTLTTALALAVDAKDSYTRSHCQTVSQLCVLIADELQFDDARVARIRVGGLLHDVGKIGIPDAILNKPAKLTDDEYLQMQTHAELGYGIVSAADLPIEAQWVRHHHERYDGRGYPDGLSGEDIPLESRIILVADAYEAMTSNRPYRKAPGQEFALDELRRHAGSQFDIRVVAALCRVLGAEPPSEDTPPADPRSAPVRPLVTS